MGNKNGGEIIIKTIIKWKWISTCNIFIFNGQLHVLQIGLLVLQLNVLLGGHMLTLCLQNALLKRSVCSPKRKS